MTWGAIAHRGALTLTVMTQARARIAGLATHPQAPLVAILEPDEGSITAVNFLSLASLQVFVHEMQPRSIVVQVAAGEDSTELAEALQGNAGASIH